MTLGSIVGTLLVGPAHSRVHGCGFLNADYNRNRGEKVSVCTGAKSCLLAASCFVV